MSLFYETINLERFKETHSGIFGILLFLLYRQSPPVVLRCGRCDALKLTAKITRTFKTTHHRDFLDSFLWILNQENPGLSNAQF